MSPAARGTPGGNPGRGAGVGAGPRPAERRTPQRRAPERRTSPRDQDRPVTGAARPGRGDAGGGPRPPARRGPVRATGAVRAPVRTRTRTRTGTPGARQLAVLTVVVLVLTVFGVRLVDLQTLTGRELAQRAYDDRLKTAVIPAERGQIVDRNGVVLATSVERDRKSVV